MSFYIILTRVIGENEAKHTMTNENAVLKLLTLYNRWIFPKTAIDKHRDVIFRNSHRDKKKRERKKSLLIVIFFLFWWCNYCKQPLSSSFYWVFHFFSLFPIFSHLFASFNCLFCFFNCFFILEPYGRGLVSSYRLMEM